MKITLLATTMLVASIVTAQAATITTYNPHNGTMGILIEGGIGYGDSDIFSGVIKNCCSDAGSKVTVKINSGGGNALAGILIGKLIRQKGYETQAYEWCASACANIWLAGTTRWINEGTMVGFHAAFDKRDNTRAPKQVDGLILGYYQWLGLSKSAAKKLYDAPPDDLNVVTYDLAKEYGIGYRVVEGVLVKEMPNAMIGMWCFDDQTKNYGHITKAEECSHKEAVITVTADSITTKGPEELTCPITEIHKLVKDHYRIESGCKYSMLLYLSREGRLFANETNHSDDDVIIGRNIRQDNDITPASQKPKGSSRPEPQRAVAPERPERHERHERYHEAPRRVASRPHYRGGNPVGGAILRIGLGILRSRLGF
jgi:hypothetical protein